MYGHLTWRGRRLWREPKILRALSFVDDRRRPPMLCGERGIPTSRSAMPGAPATRLQQRRFRNNTSANIGQHRPTSAGMQNVHPHAEFACRAQEHPLEGGRGFHRGGAKTMAAWRSCGAGLDSIRHLPISALKAVEALEFAAARSRSTAVRRSSSSCSRAHSLSLVLVAIGRPRSW